ncbi:MAG TPA: AAA family ATPase [Pyrinomonadaceae bacterium]|jgi:hypothetical protein
MKYLAFEIQNYRAIEDSVVIDLQKNNLIPIVGINECGKTTILQAIYCFDYINDSEYEGKHLKNIKNLYKTEDTKETIVSAHIEISLLQLELRYKNAVNTYNKSIQAQIDKEADEIKKKALESKKFNKPFPLTKANFDNIILIQRNLNTKKYTLKHANLEKELTTVINEALAKVIVQYMPYILYNDDFMDRPPNFIEIPKEKPDSLTGWVAIFERLFKTTNENYSLFDLASESDVRRRDSILSDVKFELNKTLTKDWKRLSVTKNDLTIDLKFIPDETDSSEKKHILYVQVVEKIKERERYFDVIDRSKGFLWFFNFVMKLVFNPKVVNTDANTTIYLLDEPGSYLHQSAQTELGSKLVDISKNHGSVIYCTHSHKLLNPNLIPLNSIYIVEKDKQKKIKATPLPKIQTKIENTNAFQPVLEALQTPAFEFSIGTEKVIAVEGIYDKYAIELMVELDKSTCILPGTSADSIIKNIQYLNAFNKTYIAIWDNDEEGEKNYKKAAKFFGEIESEKFDLLPKVSSKKRRMEEMFSKKDLDLFKTKIGLKPDATYESIISSLYYTDKKERQNILSTVSTETKDNFKILSNIIEKRFKKSKEILDKS